MFLLFEGGESSFRSFIDKDLRHFEVHPSSHPLFSTKIWKVLRTLSTEYARGYSHPPGNCKERRSQEVLTTNTRKPIFCCFLQDYAVGPKFLQCRTFVEVVSYY